MRTRVPTRSAPQRAVLPATATGVESAPAGGAASSKSKAGQGPVPLTPTKAHTVGVGGGVGGEHVFEGTAVPPSPSFASGRSGGANSRIPNSTQGAGGRKPLRVVSREVYERGWLAYQDEPSQAAVVKVLGCSQDFAFKLVEAGAPKLALPGYKKRLAEEARLAQVGERKVERVGERVGAKAVAAVLEEKKVAAEAMVAREKAILGSQVEQREEEARLVRANQQAALVMTGVMSKLLYVGDTLANSLVERVRKGEKFTAKEELMFLRGIGQIGSKMSEVSKAAVEMQRLLVGDPTQIVRHQHEQGPAMSPAEVAAWQEKNARAWLRAQERKKAAEAVVDTEGRVVSGDDELDEEDEDAAA